MLAVFVFCTIKSSNIACFILDIFHPLSRDIYFSLFVFSATTQECPFFLSLYDNQISYEAG
jgi:hypothetical protein